jgi:hypothetical protein
VTFPDNRELARHIAVLKWKKYLVDGRALQTVRGQNVALRPPSNTLVRYELI